MTKELVKIEQYNISKNTTNLIKGVAILLMLIHHFLGFPNWLVDGVNYPDFKILGENLNVWIRYSTKICVALFAFITGYAYFIRNNQTLKIWNKENNKFFRKILVYIIYYFYSNRTYKRTEGNKSKDYNIKFVCYCSR